MVRCIGILRLRLRCLGNFCSSVLLLAIIRFACSRLLEILGGAALSIWCSVDNNLLNGSRSVPCMRIDDSLTRPGRLAWSLRFRMATIGTLLIGIVELRPTPTRLVAILLICTLKRLMRHLMTVILKLVLFACKSALEMTLFEVTIVILA